MLLRALTVVLQIADAQHEESEIEREEQAEESNRRAQGAEKKDKGEDEPAAQIQSERVEKRGFADRDQAQLEAGAEGVRVMANDSQKPP